MKSAHSFLLSRTGWIGSHVVNEALAAGLKVKLAIRDENKAKELIEALEKIHGKGHIETVIVKDFVNENAYDEAIKNVDGVAHVASDMSFSSNLEEVIPPVIKAYKTLLEAAHGQKSVRRFVLTSSSSAIGSPNKGGEKTQHFNPSVWNDAAVEDSKKPDPSGGIVYAASKTLSERSAWEFVETRKPKFDMISINPNANFGSPVPGLTPRTTGLMVTDLAQGKNTNLADLGPQYHVDVNDVAKLHIIALMREDVKNERILAFGTRFTGNSIIESVKKVMPNALTPEKKEEWSLEDNTTVDVSRGNELLKDQGGFRNIEYSIRGNLKVL